MRRMMYRIGERLSKDRGARFWNGKRGLDK
jgi:hypothetical protein